MGFLLRWPACPKARRILIGRSFDAMLKSSPCSFHGQPWLLGASCALRGVSLSLRLGYSKRPRRGFPFPHALRYNRGRSLLSTGAYGVHEGPFREIPSFVTEGCHNTYLTRPSYLVPISMVNTYDRSSQVHSHSPCLFSFSPALGRYVTLSLDISPLLQTPGLLRTQECDKKLSENPLRATSRVVQAICSSSVFS